MPGKKSRDKGTRAEQTAVKMLSDLWGGEFRRSGAGFEGEDMVVTPNDFPWAVEVKDRNDIDTRHLFNPNAALLNCVQQAYQQAMGREWMLFIKLNRHWFILLPPLAPRTEAIFQNLPDKVSAMRGPHFFAFPAEALEPKWGQYYDGKALSRAGVV